MRLNLNFTDREVAAETSRLLKQGGYEVHEQLWGSMVYSDVARAFEAVKFWESPAAKQA
jgi:hypothetical protein